jgi:serine protease
MSIVRKHRLATFVAAAVLAASGCAAPESPGAEPTSEGTAALQGAQLVLAPAELSAPPGSPRQLQASLELDPQSQAAPVYFWADAPAGVSINADAWPSEGGVGNLHVLVDASVGDGDYQALVHGWRDGQTFDAPLLLHVRRLGELAVAIDPALAPALAQLPAFPDGEPRPVARFTDEHGAAADFVANELIVGTDDPAALDALLARTGGRVLETSYPAQYNLPGVPVQYLVRVDPARADTGRLLGDLQALDPRPRGQHRVSSAAGLGLVATGAREAAAGLSVGINWLPEGQGVVDRTLTDGPAGKDRDGNPLDWYTPNPFSWPHFARGSVQDIGVAEAWRALALADKLSARVRVAIIDAGFKGDDLPDYTGFSASPFLDDFGSPSPGVCGGKPCPWHGTMVAQAGFGVPGNGTGAAGPGGPVGELLLVQNTYDFFTNMFILPVAAASGARVINMSFSARVPATLSWSVLPFNAVTAAVRASGVLLVASAGNEGADVDAEDCFGFCWEEAWHTPCENDGVTCIGGLQWNKTSRAPNSNYGAEQVKLFAPYTVIAGANPDVPWLGNDALKISGTSFSSPFVAGVAALLLAADPSLDADGLSARLFATAHTSPDASVGRYVDAYAGVRAGLGSVAPHVEITAPTTGTTVGYGGWNVVGLVAKADDVEDGSPCWTIRWSSSVDGTLGVGPMLNVTFATPGVRTITATATDSSGLSRSTSVVLTVINQAPSATILAPAAYATVYRGVPTAFQGRATDPNQLTLPCSALAWRFGYTTVASASGCTPSLTFPTVGWESVLLRATDAYGAVHETSTWIYVAEPPAGVPVPTIVSPGPGGGVWGNLANTISGSAVDPDGDRALTLRWSVIDRGGAPIVIGTGATISWRPRDTIPMSCGGRDVVLKLEVTDSTGRTGSTTRTIFVNFPVC